ncbi:MAG: tyrosine--tRNA ligase [Planctomycetota bacterium]|jgi:tyrosyl-tRNA synthetase
MKVGHDNEREKNVDVHIQIEKILRGVAQLETKDALESKLKLGRPLRVKLGIDPTSRDIHLGFAVVLRKLRLFQDLGHQAVLIVGDYTAQVGDPTGKNETRPILTEEQVRGNAENYIEQIGKIVDLEKLEVRYNGEWFSKLQFLEVIALCSKLTVAQMLQRDDFQKRLGGGLPVGLHELMYPMMQGYDSVMIEADIELGGTDQLFNLLVGRQLQPRFDQEPQVCLMTPLLVGTDGTRKMSKSYGNYVGIAEAPEQQYGKTMSIPDALMRDWFIHATEVAEADIDTILAGHPNEAKHRLAYEIVKVYHGEAGAEAGREHFRKTVQQRQLPDDIPDFAIDAADLEDGQLPLVTLVSKAFGRSRSDARRLIQQKAVAIEGEAVTDVHAKVTPEDGQILRAGKRKYVRIKA